MTALKVDISTYMFFAALKVLKMYQIFNRAILKNSFRCTYFNAIEKKILSILFSFMDLLWQYTSKCLYIFLCSPCNKIYGPNSISYFCMFYVLVLASEFLFFFSITWQCLEQLLVFPSYCQSSCVLRKILPLWMMYWELCFSVPD